MTEDPAAALYAVRPSEFVAARDKLAGDLRRAGRKDEAAAIKALPRPSPSVWAINQLAQHHAADVQRLVKASRALERAQGKGGESGRDHYRDALAEQRKALDHLTDQARRILEGASLGAGRPVLDKVAADLRSAVLDPAAEEQLSQGRLVRDLGQADFSALLGRIPGPSSKDDDEPAAARPSAPDDRAARRKALADVKARLEEAEDELGKAQDAAKQAARTRARAETRLAQLKEELAEAETAARDAHDADEAASKALHRATGTRDRLLAERDAHSE